MTCVSAFLLGGMCGFALPHIWNWLSWRQDVKAKDHERR